MTRCIQTDRFLSALVSQRASPRGLLALTPKKGGKQGHVYMLLLSFQLLPGHHSRVISMNVQALVFELGFKPRPPVS